MDYLSNKTAHVSANFDYQKEIAEIYMQDKTDISA
jgi:hypothetical protein